MERPQDCRKLVRHMVAQAMEELEEQAEEQEGRRGQTQIATERGEIERGETERIRELLRARARAVVVQFHREGTREGSKREGGAEGGGGG